MTKRFPIVTILLALFLGQAAATDEPALSLGVPVERQLAGAQTHAYPLPLTEGQFAQLSIQQSGVEVVASLLGPDGGKLAEFSESVGDHGVREIFVLARANGTHRLVVRLYKNTAPPARYTIQLDALRSATPNDELRLRALALTEEARKFVWNPKPIPAEEATRIDEKFREAIRLWESLADSRMIGECLLDLGILQTRTGGLLRARELFEQALPLFPDTPAALGPRASTLNNLADNYIRFGETDKALAFYQQSLALKKPGRSRAISLDNLGGVYARIGEYQLALNLHQEALTLFRERNLIRDEAVALNNLAHTWGRIGDLHRSLDYVRQALVRIRETGDKVEEAAYLYNEGSFYFELGRHAEALGAAQQSLDLSRAIKSAGDEGDALTLLCKIRLAMNETEPALETCDRALTMHRASRDRISEAMTLASLSQLYQKRGDRPKAIEAREASLKLYRAASDPFSIATSLQALGALALEAGDLAAARQRLDEAVGIIESQRVKAGSHLVRATSWVGAQKVYESYVELLVRLHEREPASGHDRAAMVFIERARARGLLDLLAEARVRIRRGADPALIEEERALLQRLNAKDAAWKRFRGSARFAGQAEALAAEINDITTRLQLLEERIRTSSPQYAQLTQPPPLAPDEIQRSLLDPETVLLEFTLGREKSRLWTVTTEAIATVPLVGEREIATAARQFHDVLTARQPKSDLSEAGQIARIRAADAVGESAARRLSELLLAPIAERLRGDWRGKRLVIVAPGVLEYLPFAALPIPGDSSGVSPLIAEHEIVNLPSATT
ncbi:MAG: tetratricopeptide repeat protein, partial [Blastocatellia bacterium]|nr:tetratricopeptide repeat protein [Blastocatellia bacterium]